MRDSQLIVHSGGFEASRDEVEAVQVPIPGASQSRWAPVPYREFLGQIGVACENARVPVRWDAARYALANEGRRLFGTAPLAFDGIDPDLTGDWAPMIGFRQSYDQSISAGLVMGQRVFVCDNLAFSGEFQISAKNTLEVLEVLPVRLAGAADRMLAWAIGMAGEVKLMKRIHPQSWEVSHILVESIRRGIIPGSKASQIVGEIDHPTYDYGNGNGSANLWTIFNAFTSSQRDRSPALQFKSGTPLLSLFREHGLREARVELTAAQRHTLEEMEAETAEVLAG